MSSTLSPSPSLSLVHVCVFFISFLRLSGVEESYGFLLSGSDEKLHLYYLVLAFFHVPHKHMSLGLHVVLLSISLLH
jgi:hypothetical protein